LARYQFTAAAGRALAAATKWTGGSDGGSISPPELLLGLLDEAESRAAEMLLARGIDASAVLARWPGLTPSATPSSSAGALLSPELQEAFAAASSRLADFPRPFELATEHLLLGLVAARDELADWLTERGFDADTLTDEIYRLYGHGGNGQVDIEMADTPLGDSEAKAGEDSSPSPVVRCDHGPRTRDHGPILRLLDAAANRAREGLRVLEDFVRFVWNDRHLMAQLKQLRHDLAVALSRLPAEELLTSRDTLADVGTTVSTAAECNRADLASVVTANAKRLQESFRSMEEYGKVLSPPMSAEIEQLRYRTYTLERAMSATSFGLTRLAGARLYVLIDGGPSMQAFGQLAQTLVTEGVDVLQLRDKRLTDRELLDRAHRLRELTLGTEKLFIMNDRPDLAVLSRADGVHVGQEELTVSACRVIVGPQALIGVSTHSLEQARQAVLDGANYIGVGPIFASRTKAFDQHALRGPDLLRAVNAEVRLPAFAIGGIDGANLPAVLATGFTRVAVSGAILSAEDPRRAAREMLTILKGRTFA
jgi:thiamine-phosphate pyrophosphorylase